MPTAKEKAFQQSVNKILREVGKIDDDTVVAIFKELQLMRERIFATLGGLAQDEYRAHNLNEILGAVNQAITDFGTRYQAVLQSRLGTAFEAGQKLVDAPIEAAELGIGAVPLLDEQVLEIASQMSADLIKGITEDTRKLINTEIRRGVLAEDSPQDVMRNIGRTKGFTRGRFKTIAGRAETIARTEINRMINLGAGKRLEHWSEDVPEMKKYWLHTRDSRTRGTHIRVGNRTNPHLGGTPIAVKAKFSVNGSRASGPHDPGLPAKEVVNCRCTLVPFVGEVERIKPEKFVLAKTINEAEEWALRNGIRADYSDFVLEAANEINKGIYDVLESIPSLKGYVKNISQRRLPMGAVAAWEWDAKTIFIDSKYLKTQNDYYKAQDMLYGAFRRNDLVGRNHRHSIIHEFGHAWHSRIIDLGNDSAPLGSPEILFGFKLRRRLEKLRLTRKHLSNYAFTDKEEKVAEMFVQFFINPEKLTRSARQFIEHINLLMNQKFGK